MHGLLTHSFLRTHAYVKEVFEVCIQFSDEALEKEKNNSFDHQAYYALQQSVSRLMNDWYLRNCILKNTSPESDYDDIHAEQYWEQLQNENWRVTSELIDELNNVSFDESEQQELAHKLMDFLQSIHQHIGQIQYAFSTLSLVLPNQYLVRI